MTEPSTRDWSAFTTRDAGSYLEPPKPDDDKYSRGVLGVVTGSPSFPGAAVLGVEGASRTGVGMLRYLGPKRATSLVMQRRPEIVTTPGRVQAWLIGSGIDAESRGRSVTASLSAAVSSGHPVVVDAGALDLLGTAGGRGPIVITPHAGELQKLLSAHGTEVSRADIAADAATWAARTADLLGVTVLLKGHVTHVAGVGGHYTVTAPTSELATAGSGDVLAGILGALVATHERMLANDPGGLARLAATAAVLHGQAGAAASGGGPIVALQIAEALPGVIAALRGSQGLTV